MNIEPLGLAGVYKVHYRAFSDARGVFVKTFHEPTFAAVGLATSYPETFFSVSGAGVIRGMHFQKPPHDHEKLVFCLSGKATDILLDLRQDQPTFGQYISVALKAADACAIYIPKGIAHGFAALVDNTMMYYMVSTVHAPESDAGILWSSFGADWGVTSPIVSPRDQGFTPLSAYRSDF